MNSNGTWTCPYTSQQPCSKNAALGGYTVCVDDPETDCPVFDLQLVASNSSASVLSDPNYTVVKSPYGVGAYSIAYTRTTNSRSNRPLQMLYWGTGQPCAFLEQQSVTIDDEIPPIYYPLERITNENDCQDFYPKSEGN